LVRNVHDSKEFTIFSEFFIIIDRESQQQYASTAGEKKMVTYHLHKFPPRPIAHVLSSGSRVVETVTLAIRV
jgi:hypothetical protein